MWEIPELADTSESGWQGSTARDLGAGQYRAKHFSQKSCLRNNMQDTVMSLSANVNVRPPSRSGGEMGMYLNHHINTYISLTRLRCPLFNHSAAISFRETMTGHHWQSDAQESEFVPQCINPKETRDIGTEIKNETGECDKIRITCTWWWRPLPLGTAERVPMSGQVYFN